MIEASIISLTTTTLSLKSAGTRNFDAAMMSRISGRMDCLEGHPIGMPTVKELIAILSKFPEDYRVTCCGAENYLNLFSDKKYLTIDNERCLA